MWNKLGGFLRRKNPATRKAGGARDAKPDSRIDAWMREAYQCHRNGEISKAEELYRGILQDAPEYADALYFLGEIERGRGRPEEAVGLLQRAVRAGGGNARFHFSLGCALQSCGRLKEAALSYRRALDRDGSDAEVWNNLGVVEQQSGRIIEAERCYRRALESEGGLAQAHFNLGNVFRGTGRPGDAAASLRRVVELEPGRAEAWMGLGAVLHQLERQEEAAACYRRVIELLPGQHEAHYNLGCALAAQGCKDEAIESYRRALGIKSDYAEAEMNLGFVLQECGELEQAIAHYRRALELKPDYAEACLNLGQALAETGQADAATYFERALEVNPRFAKAYNNLGVLQDRQGHLAQAMETLRRAIAVAPDFAESYCNLGYLCMKDGKLDEAEACFSRAARLDPGLAQAHNNLGFMLQKRKAFDEAEQAYLHALERNPGMGEALHNLGSLYLEECRLPEAEQILRKAFAVDPRHANLLFLFNYLSGRNATEDFAEYRRWHARLVAPMAPAATRHGNDPDPRRRLRIGYVSPDFCRHSVAHFFEPLLAARDRGRYEIFCYSNTPRSKWDEVTERLRAAADGWREIRDLGDDEACDLVHRDGIDILVDLAGHTDGHRLLLFARKPAPVQVTYIGYPNTTGLDAMDYRITDPWADPPGNAGDCCYTEELVRLPRGFLCYRPDPDAPESAPLPALAAGHVTFASFNNLAKVNRELIALWSRILRAVPGSRLLLKAASLQDRGTRERITGWFAEHGVDAARLELRAPEKGVREHLEWYNRADIGLDTFPYHGTTTTCEALWMGVPVITLAGERHAGRVGVSLLRSLGIDSLIAETAEDYVAKAVALAADPQRLEALRGELRQRMDASPLCDAPGLTREIEAAYRRMWERWCRRQGDAPTPDRAPAGVALAMTGGIRVFVPDAFWSLTGYVLLEQEDWFEEEIRFVRRMLRQGDRVLDVGANYGVYSLSMAQAVGASGCVLAVEPASNTAGYLEESIARNGFANIRVVRAALSRASGTASLELNRGPELNRLVPFQGRGGDYEQVEVLSLDELSSRYEYTNVGFVKIDAEGHETEILAGGTGFLLRESPLVMFEIKQGDRFNLSPARQFSELGYRCYRLVPGLGILMPFDADAVPDRFLLNLFCCKPDRATALENQGLLAQQVAATPCAAHSRLWMDRLGARTYASKLVTDWVRYAGAQGRDGWESHQEALNCHGLAHDETLPAAKRLAALHCAMDRVLESIAIAATPARSLTLIRIASELGCRERALKEVDRLLLVLATPSGLDSGEPFLAPSAAFERVEVRDRLLDWCRAAALDQCESLLCHSTYFAGVSALDGLEEIRRLGYLTPEMERRRQLLRMRHCLQDKPEPDPLVTVPREENSNAWFWSGHAPGQDSAASGVDPLIREGYRLLEAGQLASARAVLEEAAREHPQHPDVCCMLGEIELRSGRPAAAVALLRAAVAADGESAHFQYRLGCALQGAGRAQEAAGSFRAALRAAPDHVEALNNLGCVEETLGRRDSAAECYRRALALMPTLPQAHYNLAGILAKHGALEEAVGHYRSAIESKPGYADAHNNLGNALRQLDRLDEAVVELRRAVALRPQFAEAWNNLGNVLQLKGLLGEAEGCYRQALGITPDYADALANLASTHQAQGRIEDALRGYEKALALGPDHSAAASNRLFVMHYLPGVTGRELLEQSRRWGSRGPVFARSVFESAADPERRLVIGYVSPDFRRHSVAYFFEPLLEAHDRNQFEIICYSNAPRQDEVSARLRATADRWREIRGIADDDACATIRADRVDILVDLAGHTAGNRLGIFARRLAPVAVTYLGYPGTTGLEAIGYRLTDADVDPPGAGDADYVEALVRLPAGFLCYRPEADAPEVAAAPCTSRGVVTFGSFNNMAKVNAPLIEAWSEILRRVPGARLLLKNTSLHDGETRERVMKLFASHGIDTRRLELRGAETAMRAHLEWYHSVDVALDTYPYNGTTTTCEALWMGVPVIALAGDRHAGRVGASLLRRLGLDDLVVDSVDAYVERAVLLAADVGRLQSLRREMRSRMTASPLCDRSAVTRGIEDAYRSMWRRWCGQDKG